VVAASDMTLLVLGRGKFNELLNASPSLAQTLVASLAVRLSKAYAELVQGQL
jgi:CRP-like cAMP-binding protein